MESKIHKGDKFGDLTVIKDLGIINGAHMYKVKCSCGKEFLARQYRLLKGLSTKCASCARSKNYKGMVIDGYLVLRKVGIVNNEKHISWECQCIKCGKKAIINSIKLSNPALNKVPRCRCQYKKVIAKTKNNLIGQLF